MAVTPNLLQDKSHLEICPAHTFTGESLQIGRAVEGQPAFALPDAHPVNHDAQACFYKRKDADPGP